MKLPSHTTVIAYLALFVALGGSAYAVTQLPKNSVGSKQLKANAVTTAKIKNGAVTGSKIGADAVTGANVDESTLSRVPSAGSAESANTAGHAATATSATNAASAADAKALGGVPSGGFLRTDTVKFGSISLNAFFKQTLVEVPGWFQLTTVGDAADEFKFIAKNLSSTETWLFASGPVSASVGPNGESGMDFDPSNTVNLFAISANDPNKHAIIDCVFQTSPLARISCSAQVPPAA